MKITDVIDLARFQALVSNRDVRIAGSMPWTNRGASRPVDSGEAILFRSTGRCPRRMRRPCGRRCSCWDWRGCSYTECGRGRFPLCAGSAGRGSRWLEQLDARGRRSAPRVVDRSGRPSKLARTVGLWISGTLTLATFSLLYRDNVWFKLAQSLVVGVAAGFAVVTGFWTMLVPNLYAKLAPELARATNQSRAGQGRGDGLVGAGAARAVDHARLETGAPRGLDFRWPLAFFIGLTAGLQLVTIFKSDFVDQINNTLLPLAVFGPQGFDVWKTLRNVLVVGGVLSALAYFFFSVEQKGWLGKVSSVGIAVLMITFGASFGMTVMGRISLLAARIQFLLDDWLWLIDPLGTRAGM